MTVARSESGLTLTVKRTFDVARERVLAAWIDPESVAKWFAPSGLEPDGVEMDVREGGAFRIGMRAPDGSCVYVFGEYREISPPERLVFTWRWDGDDDFPETVVDVEFRDVAGSTEVVLIHDGLPGKESAERHEDGWVGILDKLGPEIE